MTSTPVMGSLNTPNMSMVNQTQNKGNAQTADFKNLFNPQASDTSKEQVQNLSKDDVKNEKVEMKKVDEGKNLSRADRSTKVKELKSSKEVSTEDVAVVEEAIEEVKEAICEEIGVTPEDIENVLETLGLTTMALLDPQKLPQIISTLTGNEDVLTLATDEELYGKLSKVSTNAEKLVKAMEEKFELNPGDIEKAVKKSDDRVVYEKPVMPSIPLEKEAVSEKPVETTDVEEPKTFEEKIFVTADTSKNRMPVRSMDTQNTKAETVLEEVKPATTDLKQQKFMGASTNDTPTQNPLSFAQNLIEKTVQALNEKAETISYSNIQAQNILNQITEAIKIDLSGDTSEVSMRLHPESLGTVSVKVSANHEGILTAQFTAQNESVKAVIESQAIVLKETLEAKGVTVEAVEVLVQSHEFERNLSKGNDEGRNQGEQKRRTLRRIDLSEPVEVAEDSDDTLLREMMERNGNTVDYSA